VPRNPNSSAGRGLGPRAKGNFGSNRGSTKDPFRNASPNEASAPGENYSNLPKGPTRNGGSQNQSGGGQPKDAIDRESMKDVKRHTERD
jgi:hypothetical protein